MTDGEADSALGDVTVRDSSGARGKDSGGDTVALGATDVGDGFGVAVFEAVGVVDDFEALGFTLFEGAGFFVCFLEGCVGFFAVRVKEGVVGLFVGVFAFDGRVGSEAVSCGEVATSAFVESFGAGRVGNGSRVLVLGGVRLVTLARCGEVGVARAVFVARDGLVAWSAGVAA